MRFSLRPLRNEKIHFTAEESGELRGRGEMSGAIENLWKELKIEAKVVEVKKMGKEVKGREEDGSGKTGGHKKKDGSNEKEGSVKRKVGKNWGRLNVERKSDAVKAGENGMEREKEWKKGASEVLKNMDGRKMVELRWRNRGIGE